jgi:hypothetical protein
MIEIDLPSTGSFGNSQWISCNVLDELFRTFLESLIFSISKLDQTQSLILGSVA